MMRKNLYYLLTVIGLFFGPLNHHAFASSSAAVDREALSSVFTAKEDFLDRVQAIKATLITPDSFSLELANFVQQILEDVGMKVFSSPHSSIAFQRIAQHVRADIENKTLGLNKLNFYTLCLSIAMNPTVDSPYYIFGGLSTFIKTEIWDQSYDEAVDILNLAKSQMSPESAQSLEESILTILRPCDRGLWVFPMVCDDPVYGIQTHNQAYVDGIAFTGLPLKPENCQVHGGIIKPGDYSLFLYHDLLHLNTMAPYSAEINRQHVDAMRAVASNMLKKMQDMPIMQQQDDHLSLFFLLHELTNYDAKEVDQAYDLKKDKESDVFQKMIQHAQNYIHTIMPISLTDAKQYYQERYQSYELPAEAKAMQAPYRYLLNEDGALDEVHIYNPENSGEILKTLYNTKNLFYTVGVGFHTLDNRSIVNETSSVSFNVFESYPVQRAFVWSIIGLLLEYSNGATLTEALGSSPETFNLEVGRNLLMQTMSGLKEKYESIF